MLLEALIQSPDVCRDGGMTEAECSSGKHIGDRRIYSIIITLIKSNDLIKCFFSYNFWNIIPHGDDL